MSLSSGQLALIRSEPQFSEPALAFLQPKTVFACQINDTFATHDRVIEFDYDNVTTGAYGDVIPNQTCFVGSTAGAHDKGICRIRKALTATTIYVGETAEIDFDDDLYITVIDAFDPWPKHLAIVNKVPYMDYEIAYVDEHEDFDPVPIMGGHVVVDVKDIGYPIAIDFPNVADCYVYDSTISSQVFTATDGVVTNGTTTNPTLTISSYPTDGYIRVKLVVTAANGKTATGYRYVLVFDSSHRPITDMTIESCNSDRQSGGWSSRIVLNDESDIALLRERGLAIVYSRDTYAGTLDVVGLQEGRENIWMSGWIYQHRDEDDPEFSPNTFEIFGAHFWLQQMSAFTVGVELATSQPAAWTSVSGLTVDRGIWHLIHWRTTLTVIMDVLLTGDTKYTKEVSSPAQTLWQQIREIAFTQLLAEPTCDYNNRLFVKVPYNLIPEASRSANSVKVMDLTTADYTKRTSVQWTAPRISQVNLSGVKVNASGGAYALFSLSEGHTPALLGQPEILDRLLLSSQAQSNSLAGLRFGHANNPYPNIPLVLKGINRAFDIAPIQYATITLDEFSGNVIPVSIEYNHDHNNGKTEINIIFEAETQEALSIDGDIPTSNTETFTPPSIPSPLSLPPLPPLDPLGPGDDGDTDNGPANVIIASTNKGVAYTNTFDTTSPEWILMNEGLEDAGVENNVAKIVACPSGALFAFVAVGPNPQYGTIWWAEGLGAPWQVLFDAGVYGAISIGINPLATEQIAFMEVVADGNIAINLADRTGYSREGNCTGRARYGDLQFLEGKWMATLCDNDIFTSMLFARFDADGGFEYEETRPDSIGGANAIYPTIISGEDEITEYGSTAGLCRYYNLVSGVNGEYDSSDRFDIFLGYGSLISDPTGQFIIGGRGGATAVKRSNDYGRTFAAAPNINVGYHVFANCKSPNAFIAGTTQDVRYTPDWGSTWANKSGNLSWVFPVSDLRYIQHVSW